MLRLFHRSVQTERTCVGWLKRFLDWLGGVPDEPASRAGVSEEMLRRFLTYLAVERHVSASTQEQAFNALLFFYRHVLHVQVRGLDSM